MASKPRTLIINPPSPDGQVYIRDCNRSGRYSPERTYWPQTSLALIASVFPPDSVRIIDCIAENFTYHDVLDYLKSYKPTHVIIESVSCTITMDMMVASLAKSLGAITILISPHGEALAEETKRRFPAIDYVMRYEKHEEPEYLLRELVTGQPRTSEETFETLPPARQDLLPIHKYNLPLIGRKYTFVISSRGCAWACSYCRTSVAWQTRPRFRLPETIIEEITRYHLKNIAFHADVFTMKKEQVYRICELMPSNVRWVANSRVDTVDQLLLKAMKRAGCWQLFYGIESGDNGVLAQNRKQATVEQARQAVRWTKEAGIRVHGYFMLGLMGDTPETMEKTLQLSKELPLDEVNYAVSAPYFGTHFYDVASKNQWLTSDSWEDFDQSHSAIVDQPGCSHEQVKQFQRRAYREWYGSFRGLKFLVDAWRPRYARFFYQVARNHLGL